MAWTEKKAGQDLDKDLADQDAWMRILKPKSAMLKFDLPYRENKSYTYLQGQLCLQVGGLLLLAS